MATTDTKTTSADATRSAPVVAPAAPAPAPSPAPEIAVTVDEYCTGLSANDRRPELIYAFAQDEMRAGRVKDTTANFQSRFTAFASKPV